MFGLDDQIAALSDGATLAVVALVAVLLGLRHATDPDHLAAVTTLVASARERAARTAGLLGLVWGLGHATTLFLFGLPIVVFEAYLPESVQKGAETSVGVMIVVLALWLLYRWRRGMFRVQVHAHGGHEHVHVRTRTPLGAYTIGLVHGMGGSAGVGVLLLATIESKVIGVVALAVFASCTALSMSLVTTGFGLALAAGPVQRSFNALAPAIGATSLAFGVWYALGAQGVLPYVF
jgi:ABC-type nickel/cobalt efflux system permease component RcnA